jgi:hypothetical protein
MQTHTLIGALLIGLGIFLLVVTQTGVGGEAVPLAIGVAFLIAYATTRTYGLLVPGGILCGLGVGIVVATGGGPDSAPVLGLDLGFISIYLISLLTRDAARHWWPLIPGGVLTLAGLSAMPATADLVPFIVPAGLILAGLALLLDFRGHHVPRARH